MNPEHCLVEREDHVLVVTLNRPEAKNALSAGMIAGMYRAWRRLDEDSELRVGILTGCGDVFCAGADLKSMGAGEQDEEFMKLMSEVPDIHWQALLRHNRPLKPILCAVEGYALAGGTEIRQGPAMRGAAGLLALLAVAIGVLLGRIWLSPEMAAPRPFREKVSTYGGVVLGRLTGSGWKVP